MPIYQYICDCGKEREEVLHIIELDYTKIVCECGLDMKRIISKVQGKPRVMEYYSENLDAKITGPKQKARILKEKGLTEIGNAKISDLNHHGKM